MGVIVLGAVGLIFLGGISNYGDYVKNCETSGPDPPSQLCQTIRDTRENFCQQPSEADKSHEECEKDFENQWDVITGIFKGVVYSFIAFGLCCSGCVPACGFAGAKQNNRNLVICFMIMNVIQVLSEAYNVLFKLGNIFGAFLLAMQVVCMIVPCFSIFYAWQLQEKMGAPNLVMAPLQSVPMVGAQVQPQQWQAQAVPGQYPQAVQAVPGQYVGPPEVVPNSGA